MKLIKPILFGVVSGAAVFSTTYIISNKICDVEKIDERFDKINHAFNTLSNAFEEHVSDSLEDDSLDEVYKTIQNNFNILNDSISDSHNDLVNLFSQEIKDTIDKLNETITDKTDTLDNKIASASAEIETLSSQFISIENSQSEMRNDIETFLKDYQIQKDIFDNDIKNLDSKIKSVDSASDLNAENIEELTMLINNLENDFLQIDELRQSIILLETKINTSKDYFENIIEKLEIKVTDNEYNIDKLEEQTQSYEEAFAILNDKFTTFEDSLGDVSTKIVDLDSKYEALKSAFNTNAANTSTTLDTLKTSMNDLQDHHDFEIGNVKNALNVLNTKYDEIFLSNEDLKIDVENLYDSTNQINLGLLELQQGFKALEDKFSSVPSTIVIDEDKIISSNKLPTVILPDVENIKSISIFLKVKNDTDAISSNIINAFYSNDESFVGTVSHPLGTDYLMRAKLENHSLSVSGFWYKWSNRFWLPINKNDRNIYSISKLIVTY